MLRRAVGLTLVLASFLCASGVLSPAAARGARHAAMILDANTGQILHNEDGDEQRHPASLTKMMTLYLAFETIESGRMSMGDRIKISQEAASVAPSKLELEPGEDIAVSDAIKAIITKSANDIAVAMAEKVGGTEANFVKLMNAKARELGMSKTHFENASGLPNSDQVTTARDMITLALRLQDDFPKHYQLFALREFRYNGASHRNHNTMLGNFAGIDGVKTGYTQKSGFNLVSSVHRGDKHLVGAVFGGESAATRNGEMRTLLTRALTKASAVKTRKPVLIAKLKAPPKLAERPSPKAKPAPTLQAVAALIPPPPKPAPAPKPAAAAVVAKPATAKAAAPAPEMTAPDIPPAETNSEAASQTEPAADIAAAPGPAPDAAPALAPAPVEVFKVHRVMVAPRKPKAVEPKADETTDMAPESDEANSASEPEARAAPKLALGEMTRGHMAKTLSIATLISNSGSVSSGGRETVVPKATSVPGAPELNDKLNDKIAMLGAADVTPPPPAAEPAATPAVTPAAPRSTAMAAVPAPAKATAPVAQQRAPLVSGPKAPPVARLIPASATSTPRPALVPARVQSPAPVPVPVQRGNPPSTLQAQAAAITPAAQRPQVLASLQPQAASGMRSGPQGQFEIQIGAYSTAEEAQRNLAQVQSRAGPLLAKYPSVTLPVQKAGRQIVRARFRGFDAHTAANACTELRRQGSDCFVMTAE